MSVQAAILNLLANLQAREQVTFVFISHDLGVHPLPFQPHRRALPRADHGVRIRPTRSSPAPAGGLLWRHSCQPCRRSNGAEGETIKLGGDIPSPTNPPSGCVFHTRCPRRPADGTCKARLKTPLREVDSERLMRCHLAGR